ncbi:MAG: hypothetical protein JW863_17895 [Chitinispirillaceae bacterium]|nr:hypothetical protein [Chitinispirillaceae bacterium]
MQLKRMPLLIGTGSGAVICLYFRFLIDPALIFHVQEPEFFYGFPFLAEFAAHPGGLVWFAAAFITQLYQFPWVGAVTITLLTGVAALLCFGLMKMMDIDGSVRYSSLLSSLLFLIAFSDYRFSCAYALGFIVAIAVTGFYRYAMRNHGRVRLLPYGLLAAVVYYCCGGAVLLVMAVCVWYESLTRKDPIAAAVIAGATGALPFIAALLFPVVSPGGLYGEMVHFKPALLAAARYPKTSGVVYVAYGMIPALLLVKTAVSGWMAIRKKTARHVAPLLPRCIIGGIGVVALGAIIISVPDAGARRNYRVDAWARQGEWDRIIAEVTPQKLQEYSILSQAHLFRALYHTGRLLSDLFTYPDGLPGKSFMAVTGPMAAKYPVQVSACCSEVGAVNLAEFRAHEALALQGGKPWLLERLACINRIKDRTVSTVKFITLLEHMPFQKKRARRLRRVLLSDTASTVVCNGINRNVPEREYLCRDYYSELVHLFEQDTENKIALEYIIAHNLLNNFVSPVTANAGYFKKLGYRSLPRHVQEAAAVQLSVSRSATSTIGGFELDDAIVARFNRFNTLMQQSGADRIAGLKAVEPQFGSTYWYYLMRSNRPVVLE